jgi:hypothetical protein
MINIHEHDASYIQRKGNDCPRKQFVANTWNLRSLKQEGS